MNKENMANGGSGSNVSGEYIAQRTDLHGGSAAALSYACAPGDGGEYSRGVESGGSGGNGEIIVYV